MHYMHCSNIMGIQDIVSRHNFSQLYSDGYTLFVRDEMNATCSFGHLSSLFHELPFLCVDNRHLSLEQQMPKVKLCRA